MTDLDGKVQIAYLHSERVSHSFMESMRGMLEHDLNGTGRVARKPLNLRCAAGLIAHTRNYAVRLFLDKTDHEWLLFIDTDMGFAADSVDRLLDAADPVTHPIVGALCFAYMETEYDGMGGWRRSVVPTMYRIGNVVDSGRVSFCYYGEYPDDTVVPVAATGGAFLLIHRGVLEKLRADTDRWFDMLYDDDGDIVGEDIAFCARAQASGIPVHVHTGVKTSHHKEIWLAEEDYVRQVVTGPLVQEIHPELPLHIHLAASFAALAAYEHDHDGMLKFRQDLARYEQIIEATKPEVIVETGTHTGASARWFADHGIDVVSIDLQSQPVRARADEPGPNEIRLEGRITFIEGDSVDPANVAGIRAVVNGRRCMVSLDSDHSGPHVTAEIDAYGPLVTPGCYLVVEDGIFGYGEDVKVRQGLGGLDGSPLDGIAARLVGNDDWSRDVAVERMHPVSHNPAGWWVRNG